MTEEQNKLAEEIERRGLGRWVAEQGIARLVYAEREILVALRWEREPATEAVLDESELRAIASRHARDAVAPLGSNVHPGDPVVMQEKLRAEEIIFYALKEAALKGKGASQGAKRCSKCGEDITFRLMCSTLGCPLHSPAADEQKG